MLVARRSLSATFVGAFLALALWTPLASAETSSIASIYQLYERAASFPADESNHRRNDRKDWSAKVFDKIANGISYAGDSINQQVLIPATPHEDENDHADGIAVMDYSQYESDVVLRFMFTSVKEKKAFIHAAEILVLDVWRVSRKSGDVRINQSRYKSFLRILPKSLRKPSSHKVMINDLQQAVVSTFPGDKFQIEGGIHTSSELFFRDYRDLEAIYAWLDLLASTYPDQVSIEVIGHTHENRDLKVVHLHSKGEVVEKKTVVVTSALHAREWISISSTLYTLYQLLTSSNPHEQSLLEHLDFLFVPVMNPDGYAYTWEYDRLWRKNRQDTGVPICKGIDLDHSFDYQWEASTGTPCSESYAGAHANEGLETKYFSEYINKTGANGHKYYGYLDWHSYSQSIIYPYAYSCDATPRDKENLLELGYGLAKAIRWTSGKIFDVLPACEDRDSGGGSVEEGSGGSALDFMYHMHAIWAFQVKLRDTGNYGFLMPSKYITPVAKEMYNSFKYFGDFILHPE